MSAVAFLFWLSCALLIYVYVLFPLLVAALARYQPLSVKKGDDLPSVSLIVCAYNEKQHIARKLENCRQLDYPPDRIEWIVVSDGSTDGTDDILEAIEDSRLRHLVMPERRGKTACQNLAVEQARHDVLFFTDATTMHPPEALRILLRPLVDPGVGCVTGRPIFRDPEGPTSAGLHVKERYEFSLRRHLSAVGVLLGAQDCMYVIPRRLYIPVREDLDGGFVGPLLLLERGLRTVYEPGARAIIDRRPPTASDEVARRTRMVLRGLRGALHMARLLNPVRHGFVSLALLSTRLLRWLTPLYLVALLISSAILVTSPLYGTAFVLQVILYGGALLAYELERRGRHTVRILAIPLFFCLVSWSAARAILRLLTGETGHLWETRR